MYVILLSALMFCNRFFAQPSKDKNFRLLKKTN